MDRMLNIVFISIRSMLDRDRDKYDDYIEKQSENGKKWGRPRKSDANPENPTVILETHWNPTKAKKADSASASVIDSVSAIPSNVVLEEENKQIQDTKTKKKKVYDYSDLLSQENSFAKEALTTLTGMWWTPSTKEEEFISCIDEILEMNQISKDDVNFKKWKYALNDFKIYWSSRDDKWKKPLYLSKLRNSPSFRFNLPKNV